MRRALAIGFALGVAACNHAAEKPAPCSPGTAAELEVRDGAGALEVAVKPSATQGELDLCDAQAQRIARFSRDGALTTVLDGAGQLIARVRRDGPDDWSADGPQGPLLRVHVTPEELRVLHPDGVPYGSIALKPGGATLYNPAGMPVATVAARGADQVIAGTDGATRHYVKPAASPSAAGLLGIDLPLPIRVALYYVSKSSP